MSNTKPTREELIARTDTSHRIGTDTCGLAHYHDPLLGVVWTTTALGAIAHVYEADLSEWVAFVDADRGWIDCHYSEESLGEALATAVREASA